MIDTAEFYNCLIDNKLDFFTGVPDSLLKSFCACVSDKSSGKHIITANEGNAIAIAAGRYLSTERPCVVYMQNSGIGNGINPLLSLTDEEVYRIPMLLVIGWRGEPNIKDEPQHIKQGKVTLPLLEAMGIPFVILDENFKTQLNYCIEFMTKHSRPIALIIKSGTFNNYKFNKPSNQYNLTREQALSTIIDNLTDNDFVVSTTGKTSREIYELREQKAHNHSNDFLTVGSMGHTASIAFGISLGTNKNIFCIDGDGSFLMHMGSFPIIANNSKSNLKYILINNGAHESVGGQPTVAFKMDINSILKSCGFKSVYSAVNETEIAKYMTKIKSECNAALIIYTKQGSRADLGRPKISPQENKKLLMEKLRGK